MSIIGRLAWLITLVAAVVDLALALVAVQSYKTNMLRVASVTPSARAIFQAAADLDALVATLHFIFTGMAVLILIIYVIKSFSPKCAAMDWDSLQGENIGSKLPKLWVMAILLAAFTYGWGAAGILIPAIWMRFFGPRKGSAPVDEK
jgi:hypothetical protein